MEICWLLGLEIDVLEEAQISASIHGSAELLIGPGPDGEDRWRRGLDAVFLPGLHVARLTIQGPLLVRPPNHVLLEVFAGAVSSCRARVAFSGSRLS